MIDPQVAFDKLAQFQDADEIAKYFKYEGITGQREENDNCPIANWMIGQTGFTCFVDENSIIVLRSALIQEMFINTESMEIFINLFDQGNYPDLDEEQE